MPRQLSQAAILLAVAALSSGLPAAVFARASSSAAPGFSLIASPFITDVGDNVLFVVSARHWPARATATISFVSAHHGFTGPMAWERSCACFKLAVSLARRIHALEGARATAAIKAGGRTYSATANFLIRGLAANGRNYSPGGRPLLTAWVADPRPLPKEVQHFCAWVTTLDGLGVPGVPVRFSVRTADRAQTWSAGKTSPSGLACLHHTVASARSGVAVIVDVYGGTLHERLTYTPHT